MDRLLRKGAKFKNVDFIENSCRLCRNVYCCKSCREKHEKNVHKVRPDCDLCVYGKLYILNTNSDFLSHVKETHWPLHCVFCDRKFGTMDELIVNRKCPAGRKDSPVINCTFTRPSNKITPSMDESPPFTKKELQSHILKYATSTPMQRSEEPNFIFKDMHIVITPVDALQDKSGKKEKTGSLRRANTSSVKNRKVTFCETPGHGKSQRKHQEVSHDSGGKDSQASSKLLGSELGDDFHSGNEELSEKAKTDESEQNCASPDIKNHIEGLNPNTESNQVITKEDLEVQALCEKNENNKGSLELKNIKPKDSPVIEDSAENTLWTSALNTTTEENDVCLPDIVETEDEVIITKNIKKPPNTAWPTPVLTREDYKINFQICKKIFSTPVAASKKEAYPEKFEPVIHEEKTEGKIYLRKEEVHVANTTETVVQDEHNLNGNLWSSMTNIFKNVIQGFANNASDSSIKRTYSENETFLDDSPPNRIKRFRFTDIKCRRPIRDLPAIEYKVPSITYPRHLTQRKIYVDKATQTDFE